MTEAAFTEISIPKGLGPGDTPEGLVWPRSLWIVLPATPTASRTRSLAALRAAANEHGIPVSEVKVKEVKGVEGRVFPLIPAKDIAGLYRRAHRARTAVVALSGAKVLLDISEKPSNRGCITLERFVAHKCAYFLVTRPEEVDGVFVQLLSWMDDVFCDGFRDPRCLPMAIFEKKSEYSLDTHDQRRRFVVGHRAHRRTNALSDAVGRIWEVGPNHTRDLLQVAGCTLPIGAHWDVQAARKSVIVTGWERWELPGKGYANIHPDALVRGGEATRTHPLNAEKSDAKAPKTPRHVRRRKGKGGG